MIKTVLGAQLFTVRDFCKTMPDIVETLKKIRSIGYRNIQVSGFGPVDSQDVARAAEDEGLKIVSTHLSWSRFLEELDAVIAEHRLWQCKHPAIGALPEQYRGAEGLEKFLAELKPVAEKLASAEMDFSYHNHSHELVRIGEKTWLETLYKKADPKMLKAEIDTYWITAGGGDPAAWIRMCKGRLPILHLKDMRVDEKRNQYFAEIGEGNLNWSEILKAAKDAGVEYYLVEQDQCYGNNPFASLEISYRNLNKMGLT